jgi:hypothetical protein
MNNELDKKLIEKYPKIFRDIYKDPMISPLYFGFECDDGWYWLIDNLCNSIQSYIDNNSKKKIIKNRFYRLLYDLFQWTKSTKIIVLQPLRKYFWSKKGTKIFNYLYDKEKIEIETISQVVATQVKEKYGGLRFYYYGGDRFIAGMIWLAEYQSYHICETCGSTKDVFQTKGYITTICNDCYKQKTK